MADLEIFSWLNWDFITKIIVQLTHYLLLAHSLASLPLCPSCIFSFFLDIYKQTFDLWGFHISSFDLWYSISENICFYVYIIPSCNP